MLSFTDSYLFIDIIIKHTAAKYTETCTNYIIKIMVWPVIEQCLPFMNCLVNIVKHYLSHCLRHEWEEYSNIELLIIMVVNTVTYIC